MTKATALLFLLLIGTAQADERSPPEGCRVLADGLDAALTGTRPFLSSLQAVDYGPAIASLSGEERAALERLQDASRALGQAMGAFLDAGEDAAYTLRKCARR